MEEIFLLVSRAKQLRDETYDGRIRNVVMVFHDGRVDPDGPQRDVVGPLMSAGPNERERVSLRPLVEEIEGAIPRWVLAAEVAVVLATGASGCQFMRLVIFDPARGLQTTHVFMRSRRVFEKASEEPRDGKGIVSRPIALALQSDDRWHLSLGRPRRFVLPRVRWGSLTFAGVAGRTTVWKRIEAHGINATSFGISPYLMGRPYMFRYGVEKRGGILRVYAPEPSKVGVCVCPARLAR